MKRYSALVTLATLAALAALILATAYAALVLPGMRGALP